MKKRILAALLVLTCAVTLLTGCGLNEKKMRLGAAGVGGMYYTFSNSFAELAMKDDPDYEIEVRSTSGSSANLRLLSENYVQLAIAQADLVDDAYHGTGTFENNKKYHGYSAIAGLYDEACQIVVRADSDIESLEDLQEKTVSIGESESGTEKNAKQILAACGFTSGLVKQINLDYTEAVTDLKNGEIDAMFCTAGTQTTIVEELAKQCNIRLIPIDESTAGKLKAEYGFYEDFMIPANTYTGQDEAVQTLSVKAVLLAGNKLSDDTVKFITESLFNHADDLQYSVPVDFSLNLEDAVTGITIPFHSGAVSYYEELGIELPEQTSK